MSRFAVLLCFSLAATAATLPDPANDEPLAKQPRQTRAVFAGGCFWCTEAVFEQLSAVSKVVSGYSGGKSSDAKYDLVSAGQTGHAEAIDITYDPSQITFGQLLKVFFSTAHDPTQLNRQGPDWGRQYRSEIFVSSPKQRQIAESYIAQLNAAKIFAKPIATVVTDLKAFYPAEDYHQDFVKRNSTHPYVVVNALPKIQKTRDQFPAAVTKKP